MTMMMTVRMMTMMTVMVTMITMITMVLQAVDIEQCLGEGESCRNQDDAPSYGETVCR